MAQIQKPFMADGSDALWDGIYLNMIAAGAIAKGMAVMIDSAATGNKLGAQVKAADALDSPYAAGIAANAALAANDPVLVMVHGSIRNVPSLAGVAAGELVSTTATAGSVGDPAADVPGTLLGVALTAVAGGVITLFVKMG